MIGMSTHYKYGDKNVEVVDSNLFPVRLHEAKSGVPVEIHRFLAPGDQEYAALYAGNCEIYKMPIEFGPYLDKAELKMIMFWNDGTWERY